MFNATNVPSLSDIAAVTNNNDGFGGNNGWWVLIILLALFGGWGNQGGWGFGGGQSGVVDGYVLSSDFANIERKLDGVNNGLCDGFYAMNTGMLNGFNSVNTGLLQGFNGVQAGQATLTAQLQQCCCDNRAAIADVKYTMATDACALNTNIANVGRDIVDNQNANTRAILEKLSAQEMAQKDNQIAELTAKIQALNLAASQQAQNNYIVNTLRPAAIPAYQVPNPYYGYGFQCNCGCGVN